MYSIIIFVVTLLISTIDSANILVLIPFFPKSHTTGFVPLYNALASRGHNVTIITNHINQKPPPNVRYIQNFDPTTLSHLINNPFEGRIKGKILTVFGTPGLLQHVCHSTYQKPEIMDLAKEDFQLIIINSFACECGYGLLSQFPNAKFMMFSTLPVVSWVSSIFGNPVIPSFTPMFLNGLTDEMNFIERMYNFRDTLYYYYLRNYRHVPSIEAVYRSYFPNSLSVQEMEEKVDLLLINSHPIPNYPRALLPNMIETSGMHCRPGKPLKKDLQDFIDGAGEHGFIYFSMGSFLQGTDMPNEFRLSFLRAFSKLKQRVIWKFEGDDGMKDLPQNVMLNKWLPQQDILAQPSLRLFITHGGLLSIIESLYHAVPLIGIPIFADQDGNLEQAYRNGYSLTLHLQEVTQESVTNKINQVLSNPNFKKNALKFSDAYRDQPKPPLETAVFWAEYLLRQDGSTSYLHSAGRKLHTIQYHSLDVIGFLLTVLVFLVYIIFKLLKFILKLIKFYCMNNSIKKKACDPVKKFK